MGYYRKKVVPIPEKTEAQKRAQKKYMEKFERINVNIDPDKKARIKDHVKHTGESVNTFINRAIDEAMERDNTEA